MGPLRDNPPGSVDFFEVAPENWIGVGGKLGKDFRHFTERYPFVAHGLSLSIGSPAPLDETFLQRVKRLLDEHNFRCYSEHLSYCSDDGHLYDLMPIPFTEEAVHHVAGRIRRVQDILERRIGAIQLAVTDEQLGELRPRSRMVGLQFGHGAEGAERGAPVSHLERNETDQEMAFDEVGLDAEHLPAQIAWPLDLSPVQRLEALA